MTFKIAKSTVDGLPYVFTEEVEKHIRALEAHRFDGNAAPTGPAIIEKAIRRVQYPIADQKPDDFVADFEVFDDAPPVHVPTPAERRAALVRQVHTAEQEATGRIISPGKARLLSLDVGRALGKPEADRSPVERAVISESNAVQSRLEAIQYHAAKLEIEIEGLADNQLESWKPEAFPVG